MTNHSGKIVSSQILKVLPATVKDFFISYTSADKPWAEWIAWIVEEAGHTTIIQAWDFRPGSNFILEMDRASKEAHQTIALLSPAYANALFTQPEWAAALAQDPKAEKKKLLPVRITDFAPEGLLKGMVYIDLVAKKEDEAKHELIDGIAPGRAKPINQPLFPGSPPASPKFPGGSDHSPSYAQCERKLLELQMLSTHGLREDIVIEVQRKIMLKHFFAEEDR
jgi:hypothetical protein